ncbi:MAG TPA: hypothetical protein VJ327_03305 [Patescibacteria group bacterium]|nr:hypothetical protein [Patescibacteria group bacterium]
MLTEAAYVAIVAGGFLMGLTVYLKYKDGDLSGKLGRLYSYYKEIGVTGGILLLAGIAILVYQYTQTGQLM